MLYVDYGNKRVEYKYNANSDRLNLFEQQKWCEKTFKNESWHYYYHVGAFYFKHKKDLMWFRLRWGA